MDLLADESIDRQIVDTLRKDGHRVWYIAEMEPGVSDPTVLETANRKRAVLLTADKDFGELVYRQGLMSSGIVLIRLAGLASELKAGIVSSAVGEYGVELSQAFAVISTGGIRIRRPYR
jgi:predicted nuclease of predicted toxin-antitoxin system